MKNRNAIRKWISAMVAAVLVLAMCGPAAMAASYSAKINTSSCKIYKSPSTSERVHCSGKKNMKVTITGYSDGWARIKRDGHTGYIKCEYLTLTNRIKAYTAKSTPVYKRASSSSSKLGTLSTGSTVYIVGRDDNYFRVQNSSGSVTGYVKSSHLTNRKVSAPSKPSSSSSGSSNSGSGSSGSNASGSRIDRAIALGKSLIGRPYALSDNPPSSFNCSSFVEYCMEKAGYSMKGTAASQAADGSYAKISSTSDLRKGDILCFDTDGDGDCDHTAIYMGGGSFIEASQNAGRVQTNSMSSWYKSHFLWARRPA